MFNGLFRAGRRQQVGVLEGSEEGGLVGVLGAVQRAEQQAK